jgi:DNA polymerase-3 subunit delta
MKLRPEQLSVHLRNELARIYVVHGNEILLVQETSDAIRHAAGKGGFCERICLTVEGSFDWNSLRQISASLSLFSARRLLELRLGNAKPGEYGGKILAECAECPAEDTVLLVICSKLDAAVYKSRWFNALDKAGIVVQIPSLGIQQLPAWIEQRMLKKGLHPTSEAVALLAQRVEGNLLAAAQEIDKLYVLFGEGNITAEQLLAVVSDSARYSIYDLVDAALVADTARVVRILGGLRGEGMDAVLVSWALQREIRLLAMLTFAKEQGQSLEAALARLGVWEKRKPLVRQALLRLSSRACWRLLHHCAHLDRLLTGIEPGDPWDELLRLSLSLAGCKALAELAGVLAN